MKKKLVLFVSILFYAGMLLLACSARAIHIAGLPHVTVLEIEYGLFMDGDGNEWFSAALPKEWYRDGELYTIRNVIINNEYRTVARQVGILELGLENEGFYQIKNGINMGEKIIIGSLAGVTDGCEVHIVGEEGQP